MRDRRNEARLLCADLVQMEWHDPFGKLRRSDANLEDISASGACLQLEHEIPLFTDVRLLLPKGQLKGIIRYCVFRDIGYFLGVEFAPDTRWTPRMFRPMHLLDPRRLVHRVIERVTRPTT